MKPALWYPVHGARRETEISLQVQKGMYYELSLLELYGNGRSLPILRPASNQRALLSR